MYKHKIKNSEERGLGSPLMTLLIVFIIQARMMRILAGIHGFHVMQMWPFWTAKDYKRLRSTSFYYFDDDFVELENDC